MTCDVCNLDRPTQPVTDRSGLIRDACSECAGIIGAKATPVEQDLAAENARLREFIAASEECAGANDMLAVYEENERYRKAFAQIIDKLKVNAVVKHASCNWCGEKWPMLDSDTPEAAYEHARMHAFKCKCNPFKIERDALADEVRALKAALVEACDGWSGNIDELFHLRATCDFEKFRAEERARIAELRKLAEEA